MPRTNPDPDLIDKFLEREYNANKFRLMEECAEGSLLGFGAKVGRRLKKLGADWSWRNGYINDLRGKKYSGGLSGRKAIQVGLGYGWGDDPASAYVMVALAFCGYWNPETQEASVVRELLDEVFKLKTASMKRLLEAVRENENGILGDTENPIWLHLLALQEHYNFDDADVAANTALTIGRIEDMADGKLLIDYELSSLAAYLNEISDDNEASYSADTLNQLQLRATIPADLTTTED